MEKELKELKKCELKEKKKLKRSRLITMGNRKIIIYWSVAGQ